MSSFNQLITKISQGMLIALTLVLAGCATGGHGANKAALRAQPLMGIFGTYAAEPRTKGRVDTDRLVTELLKARVNTYNFLVHHQPTDWDDLLIFLPKAQAKGIKVWVTLVPPSEPPLSVPFGSDYQRWAVELAKLSLAETNLVAWSIDDFFYNEKLFTPDYIQHMVAGSHAINPQFAFVPCLYYRQVTPVRLANYARYFDGVLFPYRHEMGKENLSDWDTLPVEIAAFHRWFGPSVPVIVDVYATKHSKLNESSPEYVRQVMEISRQQAEGVLIFCHQYEDKNPEKYHVIQNLFSEWSKNDTGR